MISIIIATYGDEYLAKNYELIKRAVASAEHQSNDYVDSEVIRVHDETLAKARNHGASKALGNRLVFLDADDWLDLDFVDKITEAGDVLQPRTAYWNREGHIVSPPHHIVPRKDFLEGNHIIVGAPVDRQLFMDVGGFDEWPIYEDWALWLKMWRAGATFGTTEGVYNVQMHPVESRNTGHVGDTYDRIRETYK